MKKIIFLLFFGLLLYHYGLCKSKNQSASENSTQFTKIQIDLPFNYQVSFKVPEGTKSKLPPGDPKWDEMLVVMIYDPPFLLNGKVISSSLFGQDIKLSSSQVEQGNIMTQEFGPIETYVAEENLERNTAKLNFYMTQENYTKLEQKFSKQLKKYQFEKEIVYLKFGLPFKWLTTLEYKGKKLYDN